MGTSSPEMSDSAVKLELQLRDRDCFFVDASAVADCHVELEQMANRSDDRLLEYFIIKGAAPERVLSLVEESPIIDEARLVGRGVDSGLFEFMVSGPCVTTTLADTGAIARSISAKSGIGHIVAEVPGHINVRQVVERFRDSHPRSEVLACRESDEPIPIRTERGVHATLANQLTDKQLEVLRTAYQNGYFSWPRQNTAEECANSLGITQPTFSQHIRIAQKKILDGLFEDRGRE